MKRTLKIPLLHKKGDINHLKLVIEKDGTLRIKVFSNDHDGTDLLIQGFMDEGAINLLSEAIYQASNYGYFA